MHAVKQFLIRMNDKKTLFWTLIALIGLALLFFGSGKKTKSTQTDADTLSYPELTRHTIEQMVQTLADDPDARVILTWQSGGGETTALWYDAEEKPQLQGVAVFCKGGGDTQVALELYRMLTQTFGIPSSHIYIADS